MILFFLPQIFLPASSSPPDPCDHFIDLAFDLCLEVGLDLVDLGKLGKRPAAVGLDRVATWPCYSIFRKGSSNPIWSKLPVPQNATTIGLRESLASAITR
jgi:hypothetical protein